MLEVALSDRVDAAECLNRLPEVEACERDGLQSVVALGSIDRQLGSEEKGEGRKEPPSATGVEDSRRQPDPSQRVRRAAAS